MSDINIVKEAAIKTTKQVTKGLFLMRSYLNPLDYLQRLETAAKSDKLINDNEMTTFLRMARSLNFGAEQTINAFEKVIKAKLSRAYNELYWKSKNKQANESLEGLFLDKLINANNKKNRVR